MDVYYHVQLLLTIISGARVIDLPWIGCVQSTHSPKKIKGISPIEGATTLKA